MKVIVSIGVILLVVFGIFAVLALMQHQSTDKMIHEDAAGFFHEKKQEAWVESGEVPEPMPYHPTISGPSWLDPIQNAIEGCLLAIKNLPTSLGHLVRPHPRPAAPGVYFTLKYFSVRNPFGVTGLSAGTQ